MPEATATCTTCTFTMSCMPIKAVDISPCASTSLCFSELVGRNLMHNKGHTSCGLEGTQKRAMITAITTVLLSRLLHNSAAACK